MATLSAKIIPAAGSHPDVKVDARRVFDVLRSGGLALVPTEVGYTLMASSAEAVQRSFAAKQRRPGHTQGVMGTLSLHRTLHILPERTLRMIQVLHEDMDLSFGVVAPFRADHPALQHLSAATLANATKNGTLGIYLGGSALLRELGRINDEAGQVMLGSSANITGTGQSFRLEDVDVQIQDAADVIVDYGLQRYHVYGGRASTIIDFENLKVLRVGSSYELLRERLRKYWGVSLPPDPQFDYSEDETGEGMEKTADVAEVTEPVVEKVAEKVAVLSI
ncbi:hypothetical protein SCUCBS95973_002834 [Sporothrix curviconia]|uniref:Threonylcarbamoyl-AMP synthase n=1 Tax=Sporothrix curviconia TaxID=1260050 RepID=A0ABP0BAI3_9PEZI